jgi:hypothetical protein
MIRYVRKLAGLLGRWRRSRNWSSEESQLSENEVLWNALVDNDGCLVCTKTPKGFVEGPSGGMSTNVFCSHCGQGYNITPVAHWAELIHVDKRYTEKENEDNDQT